MGQPKRLANARMVKMNRHARGRFLDAGYLNLGHGRAQGDGATGRQQPGQRHLEAEHADPVQADANSPAREGRADHQVTEPSRRPERHQPVGPGGHHRPGQRPARPVGECLPGDVQLDLDAVGDDVGPRPALDAQRRDHGPGPLDMYPGEDEFADLDMQLTVRPRHPLGADVVDHEAHVLALHFEAEARSGDIRCDGLDDIEQNAFGGSGQRPYDGRPGQLAPGLSCACRPCSSS
ncbi:MAG: hypothetical protein ACXV3F_17355 [Frankiaceae bacterium]